MKKLGIYIHIPFCIKKCYYCDFCSFSKAESVDMYAYTEELCRRITLFSAKAKDRVVDTVYFGGGTPTLLPMECFEKLMGALRACFDIDYNAEITVECNPASIDRAGLVSLRALGINRISIGLQSANDNELKALGRLHDYKDFVSVYNDARESGFDNISVDLMYGIPEQTAESFENTLRRVCALSPEHISAYGLKVEQGTVFHSMGEALSLPDEDEEFKMYVLCDSILGENGYHRYEISNFSKDNKESRHNLKYWRLDDYVGFGVAAHSCFERERFGNSRNVKAFINGEDITEESVTVSDEERISEYIMLGLRLNEGISAQEYRKLTGRDMKRDFPMIDKYIKEGFMEERGESISFTTKGFFVSNAILSDILSFE